MHKRYFLKLVRKHINGVATPEEEQLLLSYYNLFELEPDVMALLNSEERQDIKDQIKAGIKLGVAIKDRSAVVRRLKLSYVSAAAAILIIGCVVMYNLFLQNHGAKPRIANIHYSKKSDNTLIHLPDGSVAIVMKGSHLTYPSSFNDLKTREVYLDGQAYFDIKHNSRKAFIVHTGKLQTTVLGTAFNIKALKDDKFIVVTVSRGKVSVGNQQKVFGTVTPNQQIIFNKAKDNTELKTVVATEYAFWQTEDILFDDVTLKEASIILKDRFNVDFVYNDQDLEDSRFTTKFKHTESLDHILNIICEYNGATYNYNKERSLVTIESKNN